MAGKGSGLRKGQNMKAFREGIGLIDFSKPKQNKNIIKHKHNRTTYIYK